MTQLKTLKDLFTDFDDHDMNPNGVISDFQNDLKAEAIKWIKELEENPQPNTSQFYDENDDSYLAVTFIKHFFNITDEELK